MLRSDLLMALPFFHADYDAAGVSAEGIDLDQAAADVGKFLVPFKCQVIQAGLAVTETCGGATPGVVKYDKRPTAGSDASRGDGDIAAFNMAATAAGKFLYDKAGLGTVLEPGEEVVVEIATQPTGGTPAGHFVPCLLVQALPEVAANLSNLVETT
ncbi:MAG: hypothetical protein KKB20_11470 [Proteobacteria bacterium]|nr:hypothetical protein [Pseudomonadota bacterium]